MNFLNRISFTFTIEIIAYYALLTIVLIVVSGFKSVSSSQQDSSSVYLEAVQIFADNVLANGRDQYGDEHTPLFADGIDVKTGEPVRWEFYENESWILSNFASQQNLMRVLYALTHMTGDEVYKDAAVQASEYMFANHTNSRGLLYWGGHQFVDLETQENQFKGRPHELKNNYPFYEFLWEVDPESTKRLLKAIWNAHILDWSVLDLNRHGEYDSETGQLWNHEFNQPGPFFESEGLTFVNAGTDMIQAAMTLYMLNNDEDARTWGQRLYEQYVRARHPETGLGVYQYSQPVQLHEPPDEGPLKGEHTYSSYGDRAKNQFGDTYGEIALEGNVLWGGRVGTIYGKSAVMLLHLSEQLKDTETGRQMMKWTLDGMRSHIEYAYEPEKNHFRPMWTDATDLSDDVYPRTGYYGEKGSGFEPYTPEGPMTISNARAVRLTGGEQPFWNVIRHIFIDENLGDPGKQFNAEPSLNTHTDMTEPDMLIAVLEIYRATEQDEYLKLAEAIADNILAERFHNGYFQLSPNHIYARFDTPEPLALLHLAAVKRGTPDQVPTYLTGSGETDGERFVEGIDGRPTDEWLYELLRD